MQLCNHFFAPLVDVVTLQPTVRAGAIKIVWRRAESYTERQIAMMLQEAYDQGRADTLHNINAVFGKDNAA